MIHVAMTHLRGACITLLLGRRKKQQGLKPFYDGNLLTRSLVPVDAFCLASLAKSSSSWFWWSNIGLLELLHTNE